MRPKARKLGVLVTELDDELVLYDERSMSAHRLNRTAALVWHLADGRTTVAGIAERLEEACGTSPLPPVRPAPSWVRPSILSQRERVVEAALAQLEEADLLESGWKHDRRRLIKNMAVAAALAPVILSIPAPTAAQAGSGW